MAPSAGRYRPRLTADRGVQAAKVRRDAFPGCSEAPKGVSSLLLQLDLHRGGPASDHSAACDLSSFSLTQKL